MGFARGHVPFAQAVEAVLARAGVSVDRGDWEVHAGGSAHIVVNAGHVMSVRIAKNPTSGENVRRRVRALVTTMPRSNTPEQTRTYASRSRCPVSMPACTLNTKPLNEASTGCGLPSTSGRSTGAGAMVTRTSSSWPTLSSTSSIQSPRSPPCERPRNSLLG